jgi:hypothetical protein
MKNKFRYCLILAVFCASTLTAAERNNLLKGPYEFLIGPEVFHVERIVEEGGTGRGGLAGARARIERLKPHSIYLGLEGYAATGFLRGEDSFRKPMDSCLTDAQIEGRVGYTTFSSYCKPLWLTPYFGYGKFFSFNKFRPPFPLPVTFENEFQFFSFGFKFRYLAAPPFSIGFDYKLKLTFEGIRRVKHDPNNPDASIRMGDQFQHSFDFPIRYHCFWSGRKITTEFAPFYRMRHYGYFAHIEYSFFDTRFHIIGFRLLAGTDF